MKTTAKSLRMDTKRILDAVERGEEVIVSKRGRPCARIVPVDKKITRNIQNGELFGIWKENKSVQDVDAFIDTLRSGRI
ncbi:MAG: prevent-host-death protein [Gammaproteobacteria bacterium RBG_16_51_14]|nr:MAG: prevent-host-death protein [Gammaproteobacteria bacterium RBG_16_51_14]